MIKKVYETNPLLCPSCGGKMSIIAFIEDHKVILCWFFVPIGGKSLS